MIKYDKFWETLEKSGETTYSLIKNYNISSETIDRLRKGKGITTSKLNALCRIFNCRVEDLIEYVEDEESSSLSDATSKITE